MKTIVCFGDSNTHGYCAETKGRIQLHKRYPYLLQTYLGDNYLVKDEDLSGRTTVFEDPLYEGLSGISSIHSVLMTHEPVDCLIIMLGTNDTKERFAATPSNISKGVERLIKKAKSVTADWNNNPQIIIVSPLAIDDNYINTYVGVAWG